MVEEPKPELLTKRTAERDHWRADAGRRKCDRNRITSRKHGTRLASKKASGRVQQTREGTIPEWS
jgi:hypothetical protein